MSSAEDALFKGIFEQAAVGIAHVSLEGKFELVNRKLTEMLGYSREEFCRLKFQDVTCPDDLAVDLALVKRAIDRGADTFDREKRYIHKNGSLVWCHVTVSLARDLSNKPLYFIVILKDFTKRKIGEELTLKETHELERLVQEQTKEIRHAKAQLDRFFNMSPDYFVVTDIATSSFKLVNDSLVTAMGYTSHEMTSVPYFKFIHPEDHHPTVSVTKKLLDGAATIDFTNRFITKAGKVLWLSWRGVVAEEEGSVYGAARDISELKEKEQLIKAQRSQMIEASRLHSLGEMAAGIAHEINNPLSILCLSTSRLKELQNENELASGEAKELVTRVEAMAWRMNAIIKGLKTFSRTGSSDPFEVVSLKDLIESSLSLVAGYCRQKNVMLAGFEVSDQLKVIGQSVQLSQVLVNLIMNAVDSVGGIPKAWISIEVTEKSDVIEIKVSDSGPKIPEEIVGKLFEPFFTTKPAGQGTGLGLSISHGIAQAHHGSLIYDRSAPTATFILKLPTRKG